MINLQEETLESIKDSEHTVDDIEYCHIYSHSWIEEDIRDYCYGDFNSDSLNFRYDNGFGGQEIDGFIVFSDGSWLERDEYDGSEWWSYKTKPQLKENK